MIQIVGPQLSQWDTGRSVQITGYEVEYAHFANKGDSKAVIMGVVDIDAKIPDYLLQTGKELCVYAVKDGITIESKTFSVKKRERPENYVYEEDQRNYIYTLIQSAEEATEAANIAAEAAKQATQEATNAAGSADNAANSANRAAQSAMDASKIANEAAIKANQTAKSLMVVGKAEGSPISLEDAIDQYLVGLRIFGKTTQAGTPTPDAPVGLKSSVYDGSISVYVDGEQRQEVTVAIPNGMRGIPVSSGGNYTDANGQQWISDEIDFARGVFVQRTQKQVFDGADEPWVASTTTNSGIYRYKVDVVGKANGSDVFDRVLSSSLPKAENPSFAQIDKYCIALHPSDDSLNVFVPFSTVDEWKTYLATEPMTVLFVLADPIKTPLSEEELAAYASLHTYRGNTTVSNDASAHMELEYVMDAKKYIDSLVNAPPAKLTNVTLLASKWAGSNSLYSQVVTIPGITEYSKVDLLPSVEQLAIFHNKDVAFVTENEDGVVTVYAIGDKPLLDYTMQVSITEVVV